MHITIQLFAAYREALGATSVALVVPAGATAGDVWNLLTAQYAGLRRTVPPTAVAVNDELAALHRPLADGDRVALLAPVSGGAIVVDLVRDPILVDTVLAAVRAPGAGAVVVFLGTVRDHARGRRVDHLEYEAYDALARTELQRIASAAVARWGVRIAIVHRLGHLGVGEISVAIAVSSAHRRDAFEAGRYAIDTLKQTVPVWKKEVWADGAEWIGQESPLPSS